MNTYNRFLYDLGTRTATATIDILDRMSASANLFVSMNLFLTSSLHTMCYQFSRGIIDDKDLLIFINMMLNEMTTLRHNSYWRETLPNVTLPYMPTVNLSESNGAFEIGEYVKRSIKFLTWQYYKATQSDEMKLDVNYFAMAFTRGMFEYAVTRFKTYTMEDQYAMHSLEQHARRMNDTDIVTQMKRNQQTLRDGAILNDMQLGNSTAAIKYLRNRYCVIRIILLAARLKFDSLYFYQWLSTSPPLDQEFVAMFGDWQEAWRQFMLKHFQNHNTPQYVALRRLLRNHIKSKSILSKINEQVDESVKHTALIWLYTETDINHRAFVWMFDQEKI